ncbi:hypothetical protein HDU67_005552 [Dinochytrium kinnereticum]|nr:hypothetical protein HDU67_005552 [Dinochytrium kinnereticum]
MIFTKIVTILAASAAMASAASIQGNLNGALENTFLVEVESGVDAQAFVLEKLATAGVPAADVQFRVPIQSKFFTGVSFQIKKGTEATDEIIESLPFKRAFRVGTRSKPVPFKVDATKLPAEAIHSLTGVNEARARFGLSGKGIKVAVIDSGIDYLHPALGGGFGPGFKVGYGYDLVGDDYSAANPFPVPDADPLDNCSASSHGTHVAGIVGANTYNITDPAFKSPVDFTGVAPGAIIGGYRVFGCAADNTGTDIVTAAIYKAAEDGSDIINLSLGGGPVFSDDSDSYAAEVVGRAGHIVVASNGNSQSAGLMTNGSPAVSRGALGIASFDNVAVSQPALSVDSASFPYSIGQLNGRFAFNTPYEVIVNDLTADDNNIETDGTSLDVPTVNATGKALFIRWGSTAFGGSVRRCNYAVRAGAAACILYSNTASIPGIFGAAEIPSLATTREAGQAVIAAIKAGKQPTFIVSDKQSNFPIPTGGTVSDFSSPGLDPELFIKPDLGGIGGEVLSTISSYAQEATGALFPYAVYSGTSMSSPYTAGALALFLEAKGKMDFATIRAYLQNTAKPANIFNSPLVDSVARQGAGLLNVYDAITTKTLVTPSALHLNDTKYIHQHYTLTIANSESKPVTYTLTSKGAALASGFLPGDDALQPIATTGFTAEYAEVKFARNNDRVDSVNVTVPAGGSRRVNVHFKPPATAIAGLFPVYSGYISVAIAGELEPVASVPFAGMVGSWRDAPIWVRNSPAYTELFLKATFDVPENATAATGIYDTSLSFQPLSTSSPTTLSATEGIVVMPIVSTNSRYAKVEVVFAGTPEEKKLLPGNIRHKTPLGYLSSGAPFVFSQYQRNTPISAQGLAQPSLYLWSGAITTNATSSEAEIQLPPGHYRVKFSGLKHFGRLGAKGDSNYDVVTTPVFKLTY